MKLNHKLGTNPRFTELNEDKKVYVGEGDEEVLNCEGNPCNFVYKDVDTEN